MKNNPYTLPGRCALALVLLLGGAAAWAEGHDRARQLVDAGEILPLADIVGQVHAQHAGRILEVELEREGGRYIYEVELLGRQGVVRELKYDARSGELLRDEPDD